MEKIDSTYFAPEIEQAAVSLAWHHPETVLALLLRHLNPEIHFRSPWCAEILDAVSLVYSDLNTADWPTVVDCLRQQRKLVDQTQLNDLNQIFSLAEHVKRATRDLVDYYIELLKDYALLRGPLPHNKRPPILHFSGGSALLKDNLHFKRPNSLDPDFLGRGKIAGQTYEISLWIEKDVFRKTVLKLRFKPVSHGT